MKYAFHPEAREEYLRTIDYYRRVNPQLAAAFVHEFEYAIGVIRRNPSAWRLIEEDVRRYLVHRFPYGIYFTVGADLITIWAVLHLSREPDSWKHRRR